MDKQAIAAKIDHTYLKPTATFSEIQKLCDEALKYGFAAVCVPPIWIKTAVDNLEGSQTKIATVVGFPHGNTFSNAKASETKLAVEKGADEIDMVWQIGKFKEGDYETVIADIKMVVEAAGEAEVKVIVESSLLTVSEIEKACQIVLGAGADYIKTSTGFNGEGARLEDVVLMKTVLGDQLKIKASGGIRDYETALKFVNAGADRLGCSSSVQIVS